MEEYVINNFIFGQVSKKMRGRTDLALYRTGCNLLKNYLIYPESGAIVRFPGTWYVADALGEDSQIFDFVDTSGNGFIIEINGGTILPRSESKVYPSIDIATGLGITYSADALKEVDYAYMLNQMYFVHRDYEVLKLVYDPATDTFTASTPVFNPTGGTLPAKTGGFTGAGNRPGVVSFKDGRLILGSNTNYPNVFWMGVVYDSTGYGFDDFEIPATIVDSSPIEIILAESNGSIIRAIEPSRGLIVITDTSAIEIFYTDGTTFTPTTIPTQRVRSGYGGEQSLSVKYDNSVVFVQRGGVKLRLAIIASDQDIYNAPDLTAYNDELLVSKAKKIAVQTIPFEVLYSVTGDGDIVALTLSRGANGGLIPGFSLIETDGKYKSICIVNSKDKESVWVVVTRENGTFIERLHSINYDESSFMYLDSSVEWEAPGSETATLANDATTGELLITLGTGSTLVAGDYVEITDTGSNDLDGLYVQLDPAGTSPTFRLFDAYTGNSIYTTYSGSCTIRQAKNTLSGLTHLEGQEIGVVVDYSAVSNETVVSGAITSDVFGHHIIAGLNNESVVEPLNVGILKSKFKITPRIVIELIDSKGGYIEVDNDVYQLPNQDTFVLDEPFPLYTGAIEMPISGHYNLSSSVKIKQTDPYPLTIVSLIELVDISGVK